MPPCSAASRGSATLRPRCAGRHGRPGPGLRAAVDRPLSSEAGPCRRMATGACPRRDSPRCTRRPIALLGRPCDGCARSSNGPAGASGKTRAEKSRRAKEWAALTRSRAKRPTPRNTDQEQSEVALRRQPWSAVGRVESLAESFDVLIEAVLVQNLIQSRVKRWAALRGRSCLATHIDACFECRRRLPIAITTL